MLVNFIMIFCLTSAIAKSNPKDLDNVEIDPDLITLVEEAYIYGYPLVTMDITKRVMTNVVTPEANRAPMGQFANLKEYPNASFRNITAPNADTLYSIAWLDLSTEPYILHMPNANDRYFLMPMLSGWTDVFADPGSRTTGTLARDFAIVGPNWKGKLPEGVKEFRSSTNLVWIFGRTYSTGTAEDYQAVHALQDEYKLTPLSFYGKPYTPPKGSIDPNIDMKTPIRDQVHALDGVTFFKRLAELLKENPPAREDAPIIAKMKTLGIVPGEDFDAKNIDPSLADTLNKAVKSAQKKIMAHIKNAGEVKNGWTYTTKSGSYGTNYLQRALVAAVGLGANLPQDALYPTTRMDSTGKKLNGINKYVIHFANNDDMPPVNGLWSLTIYDDKFLFVENILKRYSISQRDQLKKNEDGSVDIYIQHDSPGQDKESNWLPAPTGNFILMFRFYWPKPVIINGEWVPPKVNKV